MSTASLFDAPMPDPAAEARARSRKRWALIAAIVLIVLGVFLYWNRYWPEEHTVDKFFNAVEQKDYVKAYAIWRADQDWQQHADRYKEYTYGQFQLDWGPTGEYGTINRHDIRGAVSPNTSTGEATGVIVAVRVNGIADENKLACLWVEKKAKTINFSPRECKERAGP
jgi:hypothetical protein